MYMHVDNSSTNHACGMLVECNNKLLHGMPSVVVFYYQLHSLLFHIISMSTILFKCICILPTIILALLSCLYINY